MNAAIFGIFEFGCGLLCGYLIWAPLTSFKQGFIDGLTLKALWGWLGKKS